MAFTNTETKEVHCKVIYFGAEGSGKLTSLRSIYKLTSLNYPTNIIDAKDRQSRWFSFLPISIGHVNDFHIKLHLYSMSKSFLNKNTIPSFFQGVDGFIFVVDSRIEALSSSLEEMSFLKSIAYSQNFNLFDLPLVFQYNKRDLIDIVTLDILRKEFNPMSCPEFESVAIKSIGTMETVKGVSKLILNKLSI